MRVALLFVCGSLALPLCTIDAVERDSNMDELFVFKVAA
jgi:hypothetical protein